MAQDGHITVSHVAYMFISYKEKIASRLIRLSIGPILYFNLNIHKIL